MRDRQCVGEREQHTAGAQYVLVASPGDCLQGPKEQEKLAEKEPGRGEELRELRERVRGRQWAQEALNKCTPSSWEKRQEAKEGPETGERKGGCVQKR